MAPQTYQPFSTMFIIISTRPEDAKDADAESPCSYKRTNLSPRCLSSSPPGQKMPRMRMLKVLALTNVPTFLHDVYHYLHQARRCQGCGCWKSLLLQTYQPFSTMFIIISTRPEDAKDEDAESPCSYKRTNLSPRCLSSSPPGQKMPRMRMLKVLALTNVPTFLHDVYHHLHQARRCQGCGCWKSLLLQTYQPFSTMFIIISTRPEDAKDADAESPCSYKRTNLSPPCLSSSPPGQKMPRMRNVKVLALTNVPTFLHDVYHHLHQARRCQGWGCWKSLLLQTYQPFSTMFIIISTRPEDAKDEDAESPCSYKRTNLSPRCLSSSPPGQKMPRMRMLKVLALTNVPTFLHDVYHHLHQARRCQGCGCWKSLLLQTYQPFSTMFIIISTRPEDAKDEDAESPCSYKRTNLSPRCLSSSPPGQKMPRMRMLKVLALTNVPTFLHDVYHHLHQARRCQGWGCWKSLLLQTYQLFSTMFIIISTRPEDAKDADAESPCSYKRTNLSPPCLSSSPPGQKMPRMRNVKVLALTNVPTFLHDVYHHLHQARRCQGWGCWKSLLLQTYQPFSTMFIIISTRPEDAKDADAESPCSYKRTNLSPRCLSSSPPGQKMPRMRMLKVLALTNVPTFLHDVYHHLHQARRCQGCGCWKSLLLQTYQPFSTMFIIISTRPEDAKDEDAESPCSYKRTNLSPRCLSSSPPGQKMPRMRMLKVLALTNVPTFLHDVYHHLHQARRCQGCGCWKSLLLQMYQPVSTMFIIISIRPEDAKDADAESPCSYKRTNLSPRCLSSSPPGQKMPRMRMLKVLALTNVPTFLHDVCHHLHQARRCQGCRCWKSLLLQTYQPFSTMFIIISTRPEDAKDADAESPCSYKRTNLSPRCLSSSPPGQKMPRMRMLKVLALTNVPTFLHDVYHYLHQARRCQGCGCWKSLLLQTYQPFSTMFIIISTRPEDAKDADAESPCSYKRTNLSPRCLSSSPPGQKMPRMRMLKVLALTNVPTFLHDVYHHLHQARRCQGCGCWKSLLLQTYQPFSTMFIIISTRPEDAKDADAESPCSYKHTNLSPRCLSSSPPGQKMPRMRMLKVLALTNVPTFLHDVYHHLHQARRCQGCGCWKSLLLQTYQPFSTMFIIISTRPEDAKDADAESPCSYKHTNLSPRCLSSSPPGQKMPRMRMLKVLALTNVPTFLHDVYHHLHQARRCQGWGCWKSLLLQTYQPFSTMFIIISTRPEDAKDADAESPCSYKRTNLSPRCLSSSPPGQKMPRMRMLKVLALTNVPTFLHFFLSSSPPGQKMPRMRMLKVLALTNVPTFLHFFLSSSPPGQKMPRMRMLKVLALTNVPTFLHDVYHHLHQARRCQGCGCWKSLLLQTYQPFSTMFIIISTRPEDAKDADAESPCSYKRTNLSPRCLSSSPPGQKMPRMRMLKVLALTNVPTFLHDVYHHLHQARRCQGCGCWKSLLLQTYQPFSTMFIIISTRPEDAKDADAESPCSYKRTNLSPRCLSSSPPGQKMPRMRMLKVLALTNVPTFLHDVYHHLHQARRCQGWGCWKSLLCHLLHGHILIIITLIIAAATVVTAGTRNAGRWEHFFIRRKAAFMGTLVICNRRAKQIKWINRIILTATMFISMYKKTNAFLPSSIFDLVGWFKCCFPSTETVGLLGTGAQDVHLNFDTAPEFRHIWKSAPAYVTPSLSQPVKFPGWKVHAHACDQIFSSPISNFNTVRSMKLRLHANAKKNPKIG